MLLDFSPSFFETDTLCLVFFEHISPIYISPEFCCDHLFLSIFFLNISSHDSIPPSGPKFPVVAAAGAVVLLCLCLPAAVGHPSRRQSFFPIDILSDYLLDFRLNTLILKFCNLNYIFLSFQSGDHFFKTQFLIFFPEPVGDRLQSGFGGIGLLLLVLTWGDKASSA